LGGEVEAEGLGLRDLAGAGALFLVEWPEKGGAAVPRPDMDLHLDYAGAGRSARLAGLTPCGETWLEKLVHDTSLRSYVSNIT
jgi:tRNA threonylcarbamoyladenosine biosynthesis protein TsaE